MSLVTVDRATRMFRDVAALRDVSLSIERGEWVAVMGPSGSGKTTLLNLLGGLDVPTSGRIVFDGCDLSTLGRAGLAKFRRESVGFVFQQFHLVPYLTALENVMLAQYLHSMEDEAEARAALDSVGLGDRLGHRPGQLSGGEQQRVCIARALINHPKLILADEPTGNLDRENADRVLEILSRLHRQGQTLVVVTHDPEVGRRADRRIFLNRGELAGAPAWKDEEERVEHELQRIWDLRERQTGDQDCIEGDSNPRILSSLEAQGLLVRQNGGFLLTSQGEARARDVVRRHRLAERLFQDTFKWTRNEQIESNACVWEHILSPEVTDSICRLLGHPAACPHGRPIPRGSCCDAESSKA